MPRRPVPTPPPVPPPLPGPRRYRSRCPCRCPSRHRSAATPRARHAAPGAAAAEGSRSAWTAASASGTTLGVGTTAGAPRRRLDHGRGRDRRRHGNDGYRPPATAATARMNCWNASESSPPRGSTTACADPHRRGGSGGRGTAPKSRWRRRSAGAARGRTPKRGRAGGRVRVGTAGVGLNPGSVRTRSE